MTEMRLWAKQHFCKAKMLIEEGRAEANSEEKDENGYSAYEIWSSENEGQVFENMKRAIVALGGEIESQETNDSGYSCDEWSYIGYDVYAICSQQIANELETIGFLVEQMDEVAEDDTLYVYRVSLSMQYK